MKRRVADKVLRQMIKRASDHVIAGGALFPAAAWKWRGGHRQATIEKAIQVTARRVSRRWTRRLRRVLRRVPVLGELLFDGDQVRTTP